MNSILVLDQESGLATLKVSDKQWMQSLNTITTLDPTSREAYNVLAKSAIAEGNMKKAIEVTDSVIELSKKENNHYLLPDAYRIKGQAFMRMGKSNEAVNNFKKSVNVDPLFAEGYVDLCEAHIKEKNLQVAETNCDKAIELGNKTRPEVPYMLRSMIHLSHENKTRNQLAMKDAKKAFELAPLNSDANAALASTKVQQLQYLEPGEEETAAIAMADAFKHYQEATTLNPAEYQPVFDEFLEQVFPLTSPSWQHIRDKAK